MTYLLTLLLALDLTTARNEPNLEKRSELAMKNADTALTSLRDAAQKGDDAMLKAAMDEVRDSVNMALLSLEQSKANPRRSSSYKKAEMTTEQLVRRLDSILQTLSIVDQEAIKPLRVHVADAHEQILTEIMKKKK